MTVKRNELAEKYEKVEGTITVPIKYTLDDLEGLLISAWEGGSTYWVGKVEVNHPKVAKQDAYDADWATSEWAFNALVEGGSIYVEDNEGGEYKGTITLESFKKGFEKFVAHRANQSALNFIYNGTIDGGQLDAGDADGVFQYAAFGEWVFG